MDNLETIKYKESESVGWFYKIDIETGSKQSFNSKKNIGLKNEMEAWVESGNIIEPQYTTEEQAQKDSNDLENSLKSQKQTLIQLLDCSEKAVSNHPHYPNDVDQWISAREIWWTQLKSNVLIDIHEKPF